VLTWANETGQIVADQAIALLAEVEEGMRAEASRRNGLVDRIAHGG
jgi:hypothetical protein